MAIDVGTTFKLVNDDVNFDATKNLELISGEDKVRQDFDILLRTEKGEDLFDLTFGMATLIMITDPTVAVIERRVREALVQYRFTQSIEKVSVSFDPDNRLAAVEATITVTEEEITLRTGVQF